MGHGTKQDVFPKLVYIPKKKFGTTTKCSSLKGLRTTKVIPGTLAPMSVYQNSGLCHYRQAIELLKRGFAEKGCVQTLLATKWSPTLFWFDSARMSKEVLTFMDPC